MHCAVEDTDKGLVENRLETTLEMCIESMDLRSALSFLGHEGDESSWSGLDAYHRDPLLRFQQQGRMRCSDRARRW